MYLKEIIVEIMRRYVYSHDYGKTFGEDDNPISLWNGCLDLVNSHLECNFISIAEKRIILLFMEMLDNVFSTEEEIQER